MSPEEADLDELEEARRTLRAMGLSDLEGMTVAAAIAAVMTATMRRHAHFMNAFGEELVKVGVAADLVNDAASAAGLRLLQQAWGGS